MPNCVTSRLWVVGLVSVFSRKRQARAEPLVGRVVGDWWVVDGEEWLVAGFWLFMRSDTEQFLLVHYRPWCYFRVKF